MNFEELSNSVVGNWKGDYNLFLRPDDPEQKSSTIAKVSSGINSKFLQINYTWEYQDKAQEGFLIFSEIPNKDQIIMAWVDTWHQNSAFLICEGSINKGGVICVLGSYPAPEGPDWGWETKIFKKSDSSFVLEMYNIQPNGKKAIAVRVEYSRH